MSKYVLHPHGHIHPVPWSGDNGSYQRFNDYETALMAANSIIMNNYEVSVMKDLQNTSPVPPSMRFGTLSKSVYTICPLPESNHWVVQQEQSNGQYHLYVNMVLVNLQTREKALFTHPGNTVTDDFLLMTSPVTYIVGNNGTSEMDTDVFML